MNSRGVTLLELMVTIAILALVLLGVSSISSHMLYQSRLKNASHEIASRMQFIRSQAYQQQQTLLVCASQDHQHCDLNWSLPWIVYVKTKSVEEKRVLRIFSQFPQGIAVSWQGLQKGPLQFAPDDGRQALSGHWTLQATTGATRVLTMSRLGLLRFSS